MRILVAPDKFRGTLHAREAAAAIRAGWLRARPSDHVDAVPIADGGEGTLDALVGALGGTTRRARVAGPLGDPVDAPFGVVDGGRHVVIEAARASGLAVVSPRRRNARRATTRGTGDLIRAALDVGPSDVTVCVGGTATTDGGAGMAAGLGARLLDERGRPIPPGGEGLLRLHAIDVSLVDARLRAATVTAATDVESPLRGPMGAARVFAPQKGASPADVELLDRALGHLAAVVDRDLGVDLRGAPGAGAGGGLGFGLAAFCGARLRSGLELVLEVVGFERRLERADVVVTGEGRFDAQSLAGKAAGGVLKAAAARGLPVVVLCGARDGDPPPGASVRSLEERFGVERATTDARGALEELAREVASSVGDRSRR